MSNQLIPLPLNDDTYVSGGNGVSVSDSEVSTVSGVACKERVVSLQIRLKKRHKAPFFITIFMFGMVGYRSGRRVLHHLKGISSRWCLIILIGCRKYGY